MAKKTTTQQGEATTEKARKTRKAAEPKPQPEPEVIEQAEIIEEDTAAETEAITNKTLAKYNITDAKLLEIKEKYQDLAITDYEDKSQKEAVKLAKKEVGELVSGLEKKRVALKEPFLNAGRLIDAEAKRIGAKLTEIYEPIVELAKSVKEHEEAEKKRKQEEAEAKLKERVDRLIKAGLQFDGAFYSIGESISMDISTIKTMKDFDFDALEAKVVLEKERLDKLAEEERQRKQQEEEERKERERKIREEEEKQEQERLRLQKEREDFEKEKEEMRKFKEDQLISKRGWELEKLGFQNVSEIGSYVYRNSEGNHTVKYNDIASYTDEQFAEVLTDAQQAVAELQEQEKQAQEHQKRLQLAKERLAKLNVFNYVLDGDIIRHKAKTDAFTIQPDFLANGEEADFIKVLDQAKQENEAYTKEQEEIAEKARQEKLGDKQKLVEFYDKVEAVFTQAPKFTSESLQNEVYEKMRQFNGSIVSIIKEYTEQ